MFHSLLSRSLATLFTGAAAFFITSTARADTTLLNASYDVTREFYSAYNKAFIEHWKSVGEEPLSVNQSHAGSSKQARAIVAGLEADVATMNQSTDIDILAKNGLVDADWENRFPHHASPYTSTILFLVRKGNPKGIKDWGDLVKPGIQVIIPNPKTSGNGRYSYLGAWGYALEKSGRDEARAKEFIREFIGNVPVLDGGGRAATTTFAQRGIGDVLLTFENEVHGILKELGGQFEVIVPSVSILAESPVAIVNPVVERKGTRKQAEAYLNYLYSEAGQRLIAEHYFRPRSESVLKANSDRFPELRLLTIEEVAGGWQNAIKVHFSDGGIYDQVFTKK